LGEIYYGTVAATPPILTKDDIELPQYIHIGEILLGNCWKCSTLKTASTL
jgi:hypothetical protein